MVDGGWPAPLHLKPVKISVKSWKEERQQSNSKTIDYCCFLAHCLSKYFSNNKLNSRLFEIFLQVFKSCLKFKRRSWWCSSCFKRQAEHKIVLQRKTIFCKVQTWKCFSRKPFFETLISFLKKTLLLRFLQFRKKIILTFISLTTCWNKPPRAEHSLSRLSMASISTLFLCNLQHRNTH